jgi:CRISP-associated protein Cas1
MDVLPLKERQPFLYLQYGLVDVQDSAVVLTDKTGIRAQIPVGNIAVLMLEPGTVITHAAVRACAESECLLTWVGEGGVRLYSAGLSTAARSEKLMLQFKCASEESSRLKVVREMYRRRFTDRAPEHRSVDQLRGLEGVRVREAYKELAKKYNVVWEGRNYDQRDWGSANPINRAISAATACLYAISEAAILVAGYSPALGFLHAGKHLSFVYDIADLYKFEAAIPTAFEIAQKEGTDIEGRVRRKLRDVFKETRMMERIIPDIEEVLRAGA